MVRIGKCTSSTLVLNTGTPQGCVLSPVLFTLFTHDCSAIQSSNTVVKFTDSTTAVGPTGPTKAFPPQEAETDALRCSQTLTELQYLSCCRSHPPRQPTVYTPPIQEEVQDHQGKSQHSEEHFFCLFFPQSCKINHSIHPNHTNHHPNPPT